MLAVDLKMKQPPTQRLPTDRIAQPLLRHIQRREGAFRLRGARGTGSLQGRLTVRSTVLGSCPLRWSNTPLCNECGRGSCAVVSSDSTSFDPNIRRTALQHAPSWADATLKLSQTLRHSRFRGSQAFVWIFSKSRSAVSRHLGGLLMLSAIFSLEIPSSVYPRAGVIQPLGDPVPDVHPQMTALDKDGKRLR